MTSATIRNHTNSRPLYNSTHVHTWILGKHIEKWSWYNVRYMFRPPILESVAIVPNEYSADDDQFSHEMFHPNGLFATTPLNHYLRLRIHGTTSTFLVNAGYLISRFLLGQHIGFLTLKEVLQVAKENSPSTDSANPQDPNSIISIESAEE